MFYFAAAPVLVGFSKGNACACCILRLPSFDGFSREICVFCFEATQFWLVFQGTCVCVFYFEATPVLVVSEGK